ncbi:hypothetical protein L198_03437 [Cryptococcus wingfieldii CBS 7118]|uniref:(S)-ureidoglycine aminohydrolase cupin domain-containing protein n=1 Tax=Cryptococcus wingfieldii CBS 7118 TaxID=1295528 RepID=A0A1E3JFE1_9TREE|nr:hypothetical protein L198_03437 [Cryptococcus wingfieldii CBS 7118]ODN99593.1 hypothetical protein L198_03437 [Cryptococcus wingfieldii CBS 7118]
MSSLPPPRRLVAAHATDGTPVLLEHHFPSADTDPATLKAQVLFLQPDLVAKPEKAVEWAEARPDKIPHDDAISVRYVYLPPSADGFFHFTQTIDYLVITHGELEMELHDGTKTIVHPGFIAFVGPSEAVKVDGKGLEEPFFNGYLAKF